MRNAEVLIDLQYGFTEKFGSLELVLLASCICSKEIINSDCCAV